MNIDEQIKANQDKFQELLNEINNMEAQKNELSKEVFRIEGKLQLLNELKEDK